MALLRIRRHAQCHAPGGLPACNRPGGDAATADIPRSGASDERGNAFAEFAICLPFLAFLASAVVDVGNVLNEYLLLTGAVHQGARMAAEGSGFRTVAEFKGLTPAQAGCAIPPPTAASPAAPSDEDEHRDVQRRIEQMITAQNTTFDPSSLCIYTRLEGDPSLVTQNVTVRAEAVYRSYFPLLDYLTISAKASAPFLQTQPS